MKLVFNPFSGDFDFVDSGGSGSGDTDHHSGISEITSTETITVAARKQMTVWGPFINDGILLIDGQLILEP